MICISVSPLNKENIINDFINDILIPKNIKCKVNRDRLSNYLLVEDYCAKEIKEIFDFYFEERTKKDHLDVTHQVISPENEYTKAPLITMFSIVFFMLVFIMQSTFGMPFIESMFFHKEFSSTFITEPWRYITPAFMHGDYIHLFMNLLCWYQLAPLIEMNFGYKKLLFVTFITAVIGNFAQFIFTGPEFLGISGAIFGLIGYIWAKGKTDTKSPVRLKNSVMWFSFAWIAFGYMDLIESMSFANEAHLFGLLSGVGYVFFDSKKYRNHDKI